MTSIYFLILFYQLFQKTSPQIRSIFTLVIYVSSIARVDAQFNRWLKQAPHAENDRTALILNWT